MRKGIIAGFLGLVAAGLFAQSLQATMATLELEVAKKAITPPEFELPSLGGANVKLESLKGKVVFLNLWATWCGPCRQEMPTMERMYKLLKAEGLEILAVDIQEEKAKVLAFAAQLGLSFPILLDSSGDVASQYNAYAIPTTYLIGRDGKIFARAVGARTWDSPEMIAMFRQVLKSGPGL
jgi:thiol-disulfide isomerase/thioredoxin